MTKVPIVEHFKAAPTSSECARVERLAEELLREHPALAVDQAFAALVPERLEDAPALNLDDLSSIPLLDRFYEVCFLEERARLRASHGDLVASCTPRHPDFERYCEEQLGLGSVSWLHPQPGRDPKGVASACWIDEQVRNQLIAALQADRLLYLHPHMGNFPVWALASLLHRSSRRPVKVIAPHPGLTEWVNNKSWFAQTVTRVLGAEHIPQTHYAYNFAGLARVVHYLAWESQQIVIKVPDSAGGAGNIVLDAGRFREFPVGAVRAALKEILAPLNWTGQGRLLVGSWETDVLSTPSSQLWVPPESEGLPVVEGLFQQYVAGEERCFVGSQPADMSGELARQLIDHSWLLARLFQRLGYIGRCSFDTVLVGEDYRSCRLQFVECNGRWGGTSIPMTLMNRLLGDYARRPYVTREFELPGLEKLGYADLLRHYEHELFDARTGTGRLIMYNPSGLSDRSGIDLLVLGNTLSEARNAALVEFPERFRSLLAQPVSEHPPLGVGS